MKIIKIGKVKKLVSGHRKVSGRTFSEHKYKIQTT